MHEVFKNMEAKMNLGARMYILNEALEVLRNIKKTDNDNKKIEIILSAITKNMTTAGQIPIYFETAKELYTNSIKKDLVHEI